MSTEQITTAAELDALPLGTLFIDRQGDVWIIDTHSRGFNGNETYLIGPETGGVSAEVCVKKWGPLALIFRPDAPARTEPTEEQVRTTTTAWLGAFSKRARREFDEWLAAHDAEVRARALEDAAHHLV